MGEARKLAAILVSDVVGYSRLAAADEDRILARLRALRSDLIDPIISVHHGRIVKRTGDGAIIEFRSVVDAVGCAIEATLGAKPSNTSMLVGQRPRVREAVCAAYAQTGRTETIKASSFARRVYMRRSPPGWLWGRIAIRQIALTPSPPRGLSLVGTGGVSTAAAANFGVSSSAGAVATDVSGRIQVIWAMIFASSSPSVQFEHEPHQTKTAWRSGDWSHTDDDDKRDAEAAERERLREEGKHVGGIGWGGGGKTIEHEAGPEPSNKN
jgi:hypothetical protein